MQETRWNLANFSTIQQGLNCNSIPSRFLRYSLDQSQSRECTKANTTSREKHNEPNTISHRELEPIAETLQKKIKILRWNILDIYENYKRKYLKWNKFPTRWSCLCCVLMLKRVEKIIIIHLKAMKGMLKNTKKSFVCSLANMKNAIWPFNASISILFPLFFCALAVVSSAIFSWRHRNGTTIRHARNTQKSGPIDHLTSSSPPCMHVFIKFFIYFDPSLALLWLRSLESRSERVDNPLRLTTGLTRFCPPKNQF